MQDSWRLFNKKADFASIARQFQIPEPLAVILCNRGIVTSEAIRKFLYGSLQDLNDPFLMKGMMEGTQLLADAIRSDRKILIIGDYDADGVCAAFILESFLREAGAAVGVRIPNRMEEGYGFSPQMAKDSFADGVSLVITCDNGISAFDAVSQARELGMSVIVTEHHEPSEKLPEADVVIDPKQPEETYPFGELCGAGVAYRFMQALNQYADLHLDGLLQELLAFVAIATVADVVPLRDEKRILTSEGLQVLRRTQNPGLNALVRARGLELSSIHSEDISFNIAPCINSAGRLRSADMALDLFRANEMETAWKLAQELSELNEERKAMTTQLVEQVLLEMQEKEKTGLDKILVVYLPDAHESLAGLIAGKLMDRYYRPVLVVTGVSGNLKGSARSTPKCDIIGTIREHEALFERSGGHKRACGFTLKKEGTAEETVKRLSKALNDSCKMTDQDLQRKVWVDIALPFSYLNEAFIDCLEMLEPYGAENEKPIFGSSHAYVSDCYVFGRNRNALRLQLTDQAGYQAECILFGNEEFLCSERDRIWHQTVTVIFQLSMNEYRGQRSPKVTIQGIRICPV